jgi:hypothetical protein
MKIENKMCLKGAASSVSVMTIGLEESAPQPIVQPDQK